MHPRGLDTPKGGKAAFWLLDLRGLARVRPWGLDTPKGGKAAFWLLDLRGLARVRPWGLDTPKGGKAAFWLLDLRGLARVRPRGLDTPKGGKAAFWLLDPRLTKQMRDTSLILTAYHASWGEFGERAKHSQNDIDLDTQSGNAPDCYSISVLTGCFRLYATIHSMRVSRRPRSGRGEVPTRSVGTRKSRYAVRKCTGLLLDQRIYWMLPPLRDYPFHEGFEEAAEREREVPTRSVGTRRSRYAVRKCTGLLLDQRTYWMLPSLRDYPFHEGFEEAAERERGGAHAEHGHQERVSRRPRSVGTRKWAPGKVFILHAQ